MFEVNVNGKQYRVEFRYFDDESIDPRDVDGDSELRFTVRNTQVNVYRMIEGEKVIVCWAKSQCSTLDNFSKDVGRKQALTRLMGEGSLHSLEMADIPNALDCPDFTDKGVRTAFWQAYFGKQADDRARNTPKTPVDWPSLYLNMADAEMFATQTALQQAVAGIG